MYAEDRGRRQQMTRDGMIKTADLNGIYSAVTSDPAGSSSAFLAIHDGAIVGNNIAGARCAGTAVANADRSVSFDVKITLPPDTFLVRGTSPGDTFQIRELKHTVPAREFQEGHPIFVPS
jgi:hypothetical protein